ncbi:hypothetical protein CCMSSC00406_0009587 [Pleurotus cornucopiae]|uniref:Uncharacterized protein n=1 Tax=Pleurotus cornucopiae TaxID=5321 RepID=A0ACB7IWY2_PLECO|nr:hypothetical protein CCMSSC00406_0009587 [Pleurotus cornucopiae]
MAEVAAAPVADAMQGVVDAAPPEVPVVEAPAVPQEPEYKSETLYIQNLNEKVKLDGFTARPLQIAFVSFPSADIAAKAMKEVKGFPLYSKPMQISFARTRSDAVVRTLDPNNFDSHKTKRTEHKKKTRYTNPLKQKFRAKRMAAEMDGAAAVPATKRPNVQMPDEYLPPNKILFLQNLPESVTKDQLMALFAQYPNLHEVRLIPTKKDIAFVEYVDENSAGAAKDALHNYKLDGENKIKV